MPNYQVTFVSAEVMSVRRKFGETIGEVIDKTIDEETRDWVGEIEAVELVHVEDK